MRVRCPLKEDITWSRGIGQCTAVVWVTAGSNKGDCWLKNGTGYPHYSPDEYAAVLESVEVGVMIYLQNCRRRV